MGRTNNRIVYTQGFLQAYGLDKEAFILPRHNMPSKDPTITTPPAPAFLNSQARKKMFTKGFNLNFNNPTVQKYTAKLAPDRAKFLSQRFTGPQSWKQRALAGVYKGTKKLPFNIGGNVGQWIAESDSPLARRATKALYTSSPEARKDIQERVNEKVRSAYAPYLKGALGAAAISIPMMMMMRGGGQQQQQAQPDPRTIELQRHAAAMKPGAVYRLGTGGDNSGGYSSGRSQGGGGRSWWHG